MDRAAAAGGAQQSWGLALGGTAGSSSSSSISHDSSSHCSHDSSSHCSHCSSSIAALALKVDFSLLDFSASTTTTTLQRPSTSHTITPPPPRDRDNPLFGSFFALSLSLFVLSRPTTSTTTKDQRGLSSFLSASLLVTGNALVTGS